MTLGGLVLTGGDQLSMVYALALGLDLVTVVDNPTRQSFVAEMVGPTRSTTGSASTAWPHVHAHPRPAIAGALILTVGLAACFLLNALSFLAVIVGLVAMRPFELPGPGALPEEGPGARGAPVVWSTPRCDGLVLMAIVYTLSSNFFVLLPLLAGFFFSGGAALYAQFLLAMGAGSWPAHW